MEFLTLLKQTGIFLLVGQIALRLCPGKQFEKYIRLLLGLMVLAQIAVPVLALGDSEKIRSFLDSAEKYADYVEEMEKKGMDAFEELYKESALFESGGKDFYVQGMEMEVKNRLLEKLDSHGLEIVRLETADACLKIWVGEKKTGGDGAQIAVRTALSPVENVENVEIKTSAGEDETTAGDRAERTAAHAETAEEGSAERRKGADGGTERTAEGGAAQNGRDAGLEQEFAQALGMDRKNLEVRRIDGTKKK